MGLIEHNNPSPDILCTSIIVKTDAIASLFIEKKQHFLILLHKCDKIALNYSETTEKVLLIP